MSLALGSLLSLPARVDDSTLDKLRAIAALPDDPTPPCDHRTFLQVMRALSILPTKADDDVTGKLRMSLYERILGKYPTASIQRMCEIALETCQWFPTIAECKRILENLPGSETELQRAKAMAVAKIRAEIQARFEEDMQRLRDGNIAQAEIDALPHFTKRSGLTQGYLRCSDGERYELRKVKA